MKLIVGLGNPGDRYMNNRRNIGFKIIDVLANNTNIQIKTKKKKSLLGIGEFEGKEIVILKPQTFMDLSGEAVLYIASFLRVPVPDIIVIHDDHTLPYAEVQVATGPFAIDHIGLKSISVALKSDKFIRIRVGVSQTKEQEELSEDDAQDFLLSDFEPDENIRIIEVINDSEAALRSILTQDIEDVISRYKLGANFRDPSK